jgi:hypothetical protein
MNARVVRRAALALVLLAALLLVALVGRLPGIGAEAAAPARDFTVTAQPSIASVQVGRSVAVLVAVTPAGGFTGKVSLTASGLPAGMTASFAPWSLTVDATAASTLTVTTSPQAPIGSASVTVTGSSGSTRRTLTLVVVVTAPAPPALSVAIAPAGLSLAPGSTASYAVAVSRLDGYTGAVGLAASATLPTGVSMALSPTTVPAGSMSPVPVTLTVTTSPASPASATALTVTATGTSFGNAVVASASTSLVVDPNQSSKQFSISGNAISVVGPGTAPSPIDLAITNPNNQPLPIGNLGVSVAGTSRPGCAATDFTVRQYAGSYPLTVAARAEGMRLTSLGVPAGALPTLALLDGAKNQDACKGVTVRLAYTGSATNR